MIGFHVDTEGRMAGTQHLWLFIVSGLLLNITPGPDSLFIMARSATQGWRAGFAATWGIGTGVWPSADAACDAVIQVADRIAPKPTDSAKLQDFYALYRSLYPSLQPVFHGLHATTTKVKTNA